MTRAAFVGCDLGGTSIKLVRARGNRLLDSLQLPTPAVASTAEIISTLVKALAPLAQDAAGIGVAVPGFLDDTRTRIVYLSNLSTLTGVRLKQRLERRLPLPVTLDTDTNAGCVGEALSVTSTGFRRVLYVSLGTGLGAAFCVDGNPVRVANHSMGHIAHLPLADEGPRFQGIPRGAAESLLSARGIVWRALRHGLRVDSPVTLSALASSQNTAERTAARLVWKEIGGLVGTLAALLAGLVRAERVIVGGGTAGGARWFLPAARAELKRRWPGYLGRPPEIAPASQGTWSGALGIAHLARSEAAHPGRSVRK